MKRKMSVDQRSYDLAEYFLQDLGVSKAEIEDLAQVIQTACEDACREAEKKRL